MRKKTVRSNLAPFSSRVDAPAELQPLIDRLIESRAGRTQGIDDLLDNALDTMTSIMQPAPDHATALAQMRMVQKCQEDFVESVS